MVIAATVVRDIRRFAERKEKEDAQLPAIGTSTQCPSIQRWIVLLLVCIGGPLLYPEAGRAGDCGGSIACQCGDKVIANYQMTADLGPCAVHGLHLSSNVTLDCGKHVIRGPGNQSQHYGIHLTSGTRGATVKNCEVSGFMHGIRLREAHRNLIINNDTHQNGDAIGHTGYGIDVAGGSTENSFQGNRIHHNADEGIHIGAGSHRNTLLGNQVYDSFRENIYVLRSEGSLFKENVTRGGKNSLLLKHAALHRFENNTFHDRTALIRGDSHDNQFMGNEFVNTGIHFEAFQEGATLTRPTKNLMLGGKIVGAKQCIRFTGALGNLLKDVRLDKCGEEVVATGLKARIENTLIGMRLSPGKLSLQDNALLHVGWQLDVSVKDAKGAAIGGARVKGFDSLNTLVFDVVTIANGKIPGQDVVQYSQQGSTRTTHTPHTIQVTTDHGPVSRQVAVEGNAAVVISLPTTAR
jgi:parallel beta-helix repeat protein